ncbi:MAG: CD225/dispanin family protein [Flavobacteriaceae bacterium]|nr:CD225/dispanin family protein [Bacteroidia bacterium]MBT8287758.1 CD225/dispanin family protein [Bacteroidia bacterium]NNF74632.1 CD225/dispanin family protein [Flavobacteriaceae bacterium]NNK71882.1 CD225/dispanin family protein [Flavobacteriaceae bacterium]
MENQPTNQIQSNDPNRPMRPNNYLALAIISTILCCLPAGIVSIVYSTKVNTEFDRGNYDAAVSASKNAKTWGIVAVAIALFGWVIYLVIFGFAFLGALSGA